MKSFVVMTYYQLMHAIAMTLEIGEKTNLYFNVDYLKVESDFLDKIRGTKVFNKVVGMDSDEYKTSYNDALKKCQNMTSEQIDLIGNKIFEQYLEPYYEQKFHKADFEDEIYVYNDFQRYYYYISKHFKNIIGVEDGYCSLKQQINIHWFKGAYKWVEPFLGKYYPEPLYKGENVKRIISSRDFNDLPQYYKSKLEVVDFKELVRKHYDDYVYILTQIFDLNDFCIDEKDVLILTTPLSRSKHCNSLQNYLFYKKLIAQEKKSGKKIYIKPHPADTLIAYELYEDEQVTVLPKDFPVELLQYKGVKVSKTISFSSTALVKDLGEENIVLYNGKKTVKAINKFILKYISDEKLKLNIYIRAGELSPETYINIKSFVRQYGNIQTLIKIIVPKGKLKEYKEYFSDSHLGSMIKEYEKEYKSDENKYMYCYEIENMKKLNIAHMQYVSLEFVETPLDTEEYIFDNIIKNDIFDYFILLDAKNLGIMVIQKLVTALRAQVKFGYTFLNYTYVDSRKVYLGNGHIYNNFSGLISNRLWNCKIIKPLSQRNGNLFDSVQKIANLNAEHIQYRAILFLYLKNDIYAEIKNGKQYYKDRIEKIVRQNERENIGEKEIAGMIGVELSEYYNWINLFDAAKQNGAVSEIVDDLDINNILILQAEKYFLEALLNERNVERSRQIFDKIELYSYFNGTLKKLFESGLMRKFKFWTIRVQYLKTKYRNLKKGLKKKYRRVVKG